MSNPKLKMIKRDGKLVPLRDAAEFVPWRLAVARAQECCRWEHRDGRWVSLTLCPEGDPDKVAVRDSEGRTELADSYEGALAVARRWRDE